MTCRGCPGTFANAMPNNTLKKTICSTSFFAAASKKLCGTVCSSTPESVGVVEVNSFASAALAAASDTPVPGLMRFTASNPTPSASVVTSSK